MENQVLDKPTTPIVEIVETSEGQCCVLKDDIQEEAKEELKKSLSPLPAEEQAAVAAASDGNAVPEAVNADDAFAGGMSFSAIEADGEFDTMISTIKAIDITGSPYFKNNGNTFSFYKMGVWNTIDAKATQSSNIFDVSAANDFGVSGGAAFSTYESDWLSSIVKEHSQKVQTQEKDGKQYYLFDNGLNRNIVAIVFDVGDKKMVKIANVILPLAQLFTLERCTQVESPMPKGGDDCDIRGGAKGADGSSVICHFEDGSKITFPSVSTTEIMYIVSHFTKVYALEPPHAPAPSNTVITAATAANAKPREEQVEESIMFLGDALLMLGTGAFISILSMYFGKLII